MRTTTFDIYTCRHYIQKALPLLLAASLFCIPFSFAHATVNAGVVNGVWFSKSNPEAGETIRIFTAVQNQSTETITGSVAFRVNGDIVGTKKFSVIQNDVIPVSVEYTFNGGEYDVSAYITSVENETVAYTIAPNTSVSVTPINNAQTPQEETKNILESSSVSEALDTVSSAAKNVTKEIEPVTQKTARRIEEFRDTLLNQSVQTENSDSDTTASEPATKVETAKEFVKASQAIATTPELSLWKKVVGIALSFFALLIRLWFVFVIVIVAFIFWRLVRGQRIR